MRRLVLTHFCSLPKIDASAVPLSSKGINVLDLPLISGFINSSIAAALDVYVARKSLRSPTTRLASLHKLDLTSTNFEITTSSKVAYHGYVKDSAGRRCQEGN